MTGWINGTETLQGDSRNEVHYWPGLEWARVWVSLNDIMEDQITDIEFQVTHEGLIINVTNLDGECVLTSSQTFEDMIGDLQEIARRIV